MAIKAVSHASLNVFHTQLIFHFLLQAKYVHATFMFACLLDPFYPPLLLCNSNYTVKEITFLMYFTS